MLGSDGTGDREHFASVEAVGRAEHPYSRRDEHYEIFLCRDLNTTLQALGQEQKSGTRPVAWRYVAPVAAALWAAWDNAFHRSEWSRLPARPTGPRIQTGLNPHHYRATERAIHLRRVLTFRSGEHDRYPSAETKTQRHEPDCLLVHRVVRLHSNRGARRPAGEKSVRWEARSVFRGGHPNRAEPKIKFAYAQ